MNDDRNLTKNRKDNASSDDDDQSKTNVKEVTCLKNEIEEDSSAVRNDDVERQSVVGATATSNKKRSLPRDDFTEITSNIPTFATMPKNRRPISPKSWRKKEKEECRKKKKMEKNLPRAWDGSILATMPAACSKPMTTMKRESDKRKLNRAAKREQGYISSDTTVDEDNDDE